MVFVAPLRPRRLLVAGALLLLAGCAKRESPADAAVRTQTLLCGNAAEPADLDPHTIYALTDSQIGYALFEGLTILDALDGSRPRPGAAQSWDVSPDGTVTAAAVTASDSAAELGLQDVVVVAVKAQSMPSDPAAPSYEAAGAPLGAPVGAPIGDAPRAQGTRRLPGRGRATVRTGVPAVFYFSAYHGSP